MTYETPQIANHSGPRGDLRAILVLALPLVVTNASRTVMSFVDFVMVSELGTEAQAAIIPASISLFCLIAFGMGLVTSVSTFTSQSFGRGRLPDCSTSTRRMRL